jgi:CheY-like chemotaxis protein
VLPWTELNAHFDRLAFMSAKRILLIDDEKRLARVIQACLTKLGGWTVIVAASGSEGLVKAQTEQPDAILLDVMMPDIDGLTLLRQLKENSLTETIPVILLTAKLPTIDPNQAEPLPIAGMIAKPFEPLNLPEQIAEILNWQL